MSQTTKISCPTLAAIDSPSNVMNLHTALGSHRANLARSGLTGRIFAFLEHVRVALRNKTPGALLAWYRLHADYPCPPAHVQVMALGERVKQDVNLDVGISLRLSTPFCIDVHSMGANIATETVTFVYHSISICPRKMYRRAQAKPDLSPALQGLAPAQAKLSKMNVFPLHKFHK
jgi:hypothetical protein